MSANNDAVREHVIKAMTLILDNDADAYFQLTNTAKATVTAHGTRQEFANALAGKESDNWDHSRNGYALAVGQAMRDELQEMLEQENTNREDTLTWLILIQVLDLADNTQAAMLGENYLPESVDDVEWDEES